jgi:hypothetical protein
MAWRGPIPSNPSTARETLGVARLRTKFALLGADFVLLNLSFLFAYWLRYDLRLWPETAEFYDAPLSAYATAQAMYVVTALVAMLRHGLYRLRRTTQWLDEIGMVMSGVTIALSALVIIFFLVRPGVTSRARVPLGNFDSDPFGLSPDGALDRRAPST